MEDDCQVDPTQWTALSPSLSDSAVWGCGNVTTAILHGPVSPERQKLQGYLVHKKPPPPLG
eukprot:CAMPEP_0180142530 /NCGR_PEP_ID=MMETSP0986-20121125/15632_1 /TAXON_ID=697907 /ORGANISM="non described non described, Strain CCMP2293" /LENGTH=60 /DNA_ID=CAMNT_0022085739 /DNA_START=120 /DNA_END=298 /DNA_ORIENTATION=+